VAKYVGNYVRELRENKGYSTRKLAKQAQCSQSLVTNVENGYRLPSMKSLWELVKTLDGDFGQALFYLCLDLEIPEEEVVGITLRGKSVAS